MTDLVVASFNVHTGVDGWGRPFDVVDACRRIDADILVLQEAWSPADGGPGTADEVAAALGYRVVSHPLARCVLLPPPAAGAPAGDWGPVLGVRRRRWFGPRLVPGDPAAAGHGAVSMAVRTTSVGLSEEAAHLAAPLGTWDLAMLSRVGVTRTEVVDLGHLPRDRARRVAIVADLDPDVVGRPLRVAGTHMSHLSAGSPRQLRRLAAALDLRSGRAGDVVVAGDMNLWGPPVSALLPGLRRVVRGRSWPAWRPLAQIDHLLAGPALAAAGVGEVLAVRGSDHLPIRARFRTGTS
ncbi:MAG TPA: endonuclease/exonuclease/phosphatase family protein [Acidimicrobiales bacterium]|nr:endonuclease/exonuclease/phosphatase family protein [Acidimicrobiales bacterium]